VHFGGNILRWGYHLGVGVTTTKHIKWERNSASKSAGDFIEGQHTLMSAILDESWSIVHGELTQKNNLQQAYDFCMKTFEWRVSYN
jgi:hypothetical protein